MVLSKECIVLAGGFGTRLQSVINDVPKCMAPINHIPFISLLFDYLEKELFSHVILSLGYKADRVLDWIQTENRKFKISYVIEEKPLGTGGAIKYAIQLAKSTQIFVFNGDTYFDISTQKLEIFHQSKQADISLALKPMKNFCRYGTVQLNNEGKIIKFIEKQEVQQGNINGGIYLINRDMLMNTATESSFSFEKDILEAKLDTLNIYGDIFNNYFIDIGIPEDFDKMNKDFA